MPRLITTATKYLSIGEVAHRYDVEPRTIDRWLKGGRIPLPDFRIGARQRRWSVEKLDAHDREMIARARQADQQRNPDAGPL